MTAKNVILTCLAICVTTSCTAEPDAQHALPPFGQNIPQNYTLVYETDFITEDTLADFEMSDPAIWRRVEEQGDACLELFTIKGAYTPPVRSPHAIALLKKFMVGDFILEVDAESTNIRAGAHRDTCYFFGFTNPSNFYYVHIASGADPNAHNIFLVKDAPRTNIASYTTKGIDWGVGIRHRIRIERTGAAGALRVFFDDMNEPIMKASDNNFGFGYVGIGSFDDTARYYDLKVYAPETKEGKDGFFKPE
jgi:hypothetical protein